MATDLDLDTVRQTIEGRISTNWSATSIAWPGVDFDKPEASWVRPFILWGDGFRRTVDGYNEVVGILRTQFFAKQGTGYGGLYDLADAWRELFDNVTVSGVEFRAASGFKPIDEPRPGWVGGIVDVPFRVFETAA